MRKGAGFDGIRAKDLKENASFLTPTITKLINSSLELAIVPDLLKTSIVRPIYKSSGNQSDVNNYRPISILSAIDKVLEEIIVRRLTSYLQKYKVINGNQYGFQKGKNINKLLGNFSNTINENLSKNMHVLVLFIDFSKAFDTLSHSKMLHILEKIGIRGNILKWFKSYLERRSYCVKINNKLSNLITYDCGVPQGSKLGPILYIIYANDMMKCLSEGTTFAYADDTAIVIADKNISIATEKMQNQLNIATKWCHDNGLIINASKTKVMHIKPTHMEDTIIKIKYHDIQCLHNKTMDSNINDTCSKIIEKVDTYKYLGVYVDKSFKWKIHIQNLQKKMRKAAYMLFHLSNCATYNVLRQAYFSLAESYIRHGITAWGNAKYNSTLQKTQNQLLKILWKKYNYNIANNNINSNTNVLNNNHQIENNTNHNISSQNYNIINNNILTNINNNNINTTNINSNKLAKNLHVLNVKNIFFTTLAKEFYSNNNFLQPISHAHNTRSRAQGRFKVERFINEYGRSRLPVILPTIFNKIPISIINEKNNYKRNKLIKNYFINLQ